MYKGLFQKSFKVAGVSLPLEFFLRLTDTTTLRKKVFKNVQARCATLARGTWSLLRGLSVLRNRSFRAQKPGPQDHRGEQHPQGFEALRAEGSALHPGVGPRRLLGSSQVKTLSDLDLWNQL